MAGHGDGVRIGGKGGQAERADKHQARQQAIYHGFSFQIEPPILGKASKKTGAKSGRVCRLAGPKILLYPLSGRACSSVG